ncbi:MAG: hypothetical protein DRP37_00830 [Thermodesulfobacteriota bacterium]|nr:MAG: hypothetical protein DRP37_00830 [Thermodesulfobacteriota bacterium]
MPTDYTHNRASYGKWSFPALNAPVFRPGDFKRLWAVLLVIAIWLSISVISQCLEPGAVHAKESQVESGPYEIIISMDPFDPERGKNQAVISVVEKDLKGRYQVYGTIIAGEMRQAFLMVEASKPAPGLRKKVARGSQKNLRIVTVGDVVDGWRVADITAQSVKFESDGEYVEVGIFDEAKKERKATAPVALQTPRPKPEVRRVPQSIPAKRPSSGKPGSSSQKKPGKRIPRNSKKPTTKESQEIIGKTGSGKHLEVVIPPAPSDHSFLELIKKAKEE